MELNSRELHAAKSNPQCTAGDTAKPDSDAAESASDHRPHASADANAVPPSAGSAHGQNDVRGQRDAHAHDQKSRWVSHGSDAAVL